MQHKHTAQGLASLGRGPDTELVHMTKGEVHGLQKLAMAHGGTLTINPETGLAEAGFLSSILPMIAGAGLMMIPGVNVAMAAGLVGGGTALATGSLKKGLMAGLGAYGGAGLAGGLMGAGTAATSGSLGTVGAAEAGSLTNAAQADLLSAQTAGNADAYNTMAKAASAGPVTITPPGGLPATLASPAANIGFEAMPSQAGLAQAQTANDLTGYGYLDKTMQTPYPQPVAPVAPVTAAVPQTAVAQPLNYDPYDFGRATSKLTPYEQMGRGFTDVTSSGPKALDFVKANPGAFLSAGAGILGGMGPSTLNAPEQNPGMIRPYTFTRTRNEQPDALGALYTPGQSTRERQYFTDQYTAGTPYKAPGPEYLADGGIARAAPMNSKMAAFAAASDKLSTQQGLRDTIAAAKTGDRAALSALQGAGYDLNNLNTFAGGGPVEAMSNANAIGANTGYPMADIHTGAYATPYQQPMSENVVQGAQDAAVDPYTGQATFAAGGGISNLGGYSDGGQLLRGPGDGVSDNIPAMIGQKQHARLADGEFVVPARIVSELGNGSTEAGSRQLYAMMDRVQNARKKSIGKNKVATNSRAAKLLPA